MSTPSTAFGLSRIGQIAVVVKDTARASAFYRDTLGMKFLFAAGQLSFFDCDGIRLMLDRAEKPEFEHMASILYFRVPDIRAAHQTLLGRGVKFEDEPHMLAKMPDHELWMCFFRDSEANLMALMSEVR